MSHLLLLSGGMDSALLLQRYGAKLAVGFDYGQRHWIELRYAARLAEKFGVPFEQHALPVLHSVDGVIFAGRNAVMLSAAAAIAQSRGLDTVVIGCNFTDAMRFPDCRPEFIKAMNTALRQGYGVTVSAPLLTQSKEQIKQEAKDLETWSCYAPTADDTPCGKCLACQLTGEQT